jgi:condensin complex subunit 3
MKSREEMSAEERMQADITDIRCLTLCIGMLEHVHGVCLYSPSHEIVI